MTDIPMTKDAGRFTISSPVRTETDSILVGSDEEKLIPVASPTCCSMLVFESDSTRRLYERIY